MFRFARCLMGNCSLLLLLLFSLSVFLLAQVETATVAGEVSDPSGLSISGAQVSIVDIDRGTMLTATTDHAGSYRFASVHPGQYRMQVRASGFRVVDVTGLTVNVQDHLQQNFKLAVGSVSESVTVEGGAALLDTEIASISTVVDRNFAENLPMNGRSFQTLIELTPGVVLVPSSVNDPGQFSINGQRASSNYWQIDGVSANIGVGASYVQGTGAAGASPGFSAQGGTNSLVSVDALQEFRIQTSTYAPEFGRTPGGQISIVTRSGTNHWHGTAFDYFRNDVLDASDWFNGTTEPPVPKAKERQNDFGGTLSGPIVKDATFFFFSYEGLRLRLPQTSITSVPDLTSRQNASLATRPFLAAFPLPNGPGLGAGVAQFSASYSNPATLNATSLRLDHRVRGNVLVFGRYNYSPSELSQRGNASNGYSSNTITSSGINVHTATIGATWNIGPNATNDLRFNYSQTNSNGNFALDNFGDASPLTTLPLPRPFTSNNSTFTFSDFALTSGFLSVGRLAENIQRQVNVIETLSFRKKSHNLKLGADYRRLNPSFDPPIYTQQNLFFGEIDAEAANLGAAFLTTGRPSTTVFKNLGAFAQDTWHVNPSLTITYGLRWDVDFSPETESGPHFAAVSNVGDLAHLNVAPPGAPPFKTSFEDVAPRLGAAYQPWRKSGWEAVMHGGFGVFYDLATAEAGNISNAAYYPFGATNTVLGTALGGAASFPLSAADAAPPLISLSQLRSGGYLAAFDPNLTLPYTLQWNVALEQSLGPEERLSLSYLGAAGRRLLQSQYASNLNPNISNALLVGNYATSDYDALQVQFQRRLSRGIQVLASYTFAHSIDTASASSIGNATNIYNPKTAARNNRGPSDFDIRSSVSGGLTYEIPAPRANRIGELILRGWSLQNVFQARTATPETIYVAGVLYAGSFQAVRADVVPGQPFYLSGSEFPGGKAFNPAAFTKPPIDSVTGAAKREGTLGRNGLRAFDAWQWDFAVHRSFPIHEAIRVEFRSEIFNVLNHPNFGSPGPYLGVRPFGQATQMLANSLSRGSVGAGALDPLYQFGGPRSIQFALKLTF